MFCLVMPGSSPAMRAVPADRLRERKLGYIRVMNRNQLWTIIAVCGGAAVAIVAVTGAPGIAYLVVSIVLAAAYAVVGQVTKGDDIRRQRGHDRHRS
jgi:hypothetical protein